MSEMTSYLAREMERNDEDALREINKLIRSLKAAGDAIREGKGTMVTDTDWLCSSAAKVERMIEKRNLVGMLQTVDAVTAERSINSIVSERLAAERPTGLARRVAKELGKRLDNEMIPCVRGTVGCGALHADGGSSLSSCETL